MSELIQFIRESAGFITPDEIQNLVTQKGLDVNAKRSDNSDALYWALDMQLEEIGFQLLALGAEANADAVYVAAQRGCFEILKELLKRGAPFDEPFAIKGFTPLLAAVAESSDYYRTNLKVTKKFDGKDVLVTDPEEIEKVAGKDRYLDFIKIVSALLERGADPEAVTPEQKQNVLHYVGDRGGVHIGKLLLQHGADVKRPDAYGLTPLHWAARRGFADIVQLFLAYKADPNAREDYGFTPLHEAAENNHPEVINLLLGAGGNKSMGILKDFELYKQGDTPYTIAEKKGHTAILASLKP